ncbi:hypothetical protein [Acidovorax sp. sic0104]|uniref:hypothetical protein n=1 Tax=Acidovorax sp. sic0104 TaxID=2854784 RepID=UPI001C443405|nr:hypothetical protein [Acidovorax sp. sic0104]MBV7542026.1 hypothetical protein [Acidovorax sp. sic0104]
MQTNKTPSSDELSAVSAGHKPHAALRALFESWTKATATHGTGDILADLEQMIGGLEHLRAQIRPALPTSCGGFAGLQRTDAIKLLRQAGVEVSETPGGYFGYTGCDASQWECLDDAISAALQLHPQVLPQTMALAIKGEVSAT